MLNRDQFVAYGTALNALATVGVAYAPGVWLAAPAMVVAGAAWISVANSLTVTAQLTLQLAPPRGGLGQARGAIGDERKEPKSEQLNPVSNAESR